jgi:GT2 family glycosyltransferase
MPQCGPEESERGRDTTGAGKLNQSRFPGMTTAFNQFKQFIAKQMARTRTVLRALRYGSEEDKFRVIRFVALRLPLSPEGRQRFIDWSLNRIGDRKRLSSAARIRSAQGEWDKKGQKRLQWLLAGTQTHEFPSAVSPRVSFVVVLHNKAHLSLLTIESVLQTADLSYELVIVDNGSTDLTSRMLDRIRGAKILRNATNIGFGPACMQAAAAASGEYLCFLNNDALPAPDAVSVMLENFDREGVGAVGTKVLLADGTLQEAGSIIWSDGSALGYGRRDDPDLPQYNFRRPVDYCSAVFLITPKDLFRRLGGFSEQFAPAYYEDTDYCMVLWQNGLSVVYEPLAYVLHYESASSGGNDLATAMMAAHQLKFKEKWASVLDSHYAPRPSNICAARISVNSRSLRIVYIDDRIPKRTLGAGFPRSNDVVTTLARTGHHVVCSTSTFPVIRDAYEDLPREIEIFDGYRFRQRLIDEYLPCADVVWVSRPHNLKLLLTEHPAALADRKFALVYDAEAIFASRARDQAEVLGPAAVPLNPLEPSCLEEELSLAKMADAVAVVSEADRQVMLQAGIRSVHIIGHSISATPTTSPFQKRDAFLFVGSVHGSDNPNADSIREFYSTHWAGIHRATGATFIVAGYGTELLRGEIADPTVEILGKQDDLRPLYDRARVFVVPTRFAAGMPFKAHEAAGFGVPMVVSPVIARQMQWESGADYFAADDPNRMAEFCIRLYGDERLWESFRDNSLARVQSELSPTAFVNGLRSILEKVTAASTDTRSYSKK